MLLCINYEINAFGQRGNRILKKLFFAALVFIGCCAFVFAEDMNVYAGADQATQAKLSAVDALVAVQKYDSAFKLIAGESKNPFLVAKQVELATNYFVQSLNHKMFAFKDLEPGETLEALRSGNGTFSMYSFDPETVIGGLLDSGTKAPILYVALGDYYYDVSLRYQGRWTEDDQTIAQKAIENYKKAISGGIVTSNILANYADKASELGDYKVASDLYERALMLDPTLINADYNIAYDNLMLGNYDIAIAEGEKAIQIYADNANYRMDAILLCSDAAYYNNNYSLALDYLAKALDISHDEYRVYQKLGNVYLGLGDIKNANDSLDSLFAFAPTNPAATQMVSKVYLTVKNASALFDFYQRNLDKYKTQPEAQGNLYFHLGLQYETDGKKAEALNAAKKAKDAFIKAGKYDGEIQTAVDSLIARNS